MEAVITTDDGVPQYTKFNYNRLDFGRVHRGCEKLKRKMKNKKFTKIFRPFNRKYVDGSNL